MSAPFRTLLTRFRALFVVASASAAAFALISCGDAAAPKAGSTPPSKVSRNILDGNHGGNAHFFFLSPLIPGVSFGSGVSDGSQHPTVVICEWQSDNSCGAIVAQFNRTGGSTSSDITYDPTAGQYQVNWKTDQCGGVSCILDPAKTYRLRVLAGVYELGHADIDVVTGGSQLKNVQTGEYIGLVDGRTLPIKFRIEKGAASFASVENPVSV